MGSLVLGLVLSGRVRGFVVVLFVGIFVAWTWRSVGAVLLLVVSCAGMVVLQRRLCWRDLV